MQYATPQLRSIDSLVRQGRFLQARSDALAYAAETGDGADRQARGQLAFVLGKIYRNIGDYGDAEREYLSAAETFRVAGDDESTADALSGAALARWQLCDFARATELQLEALRTYERIGDRLGLANAHNNLGLIAWKREDFSRAIESFEAALALYEELSHAQGLAATVNNLGGVVQDAGDLERSAGYYGEAERLYRRAEDEAGAALAAGNLAWTLARLGKPGEAAPFAERAVSGFRRAGDKAGLYRALMQRAAVLAAEGKPRDAAIDLYRAAHGARDLGCAELESVTLQDLVEVLGSLGRHRRAAAWYGRILSLEKRIRDEASEREIARLRLDLELEFRKEEEERLKAALRDRDRLLSTLVHDARAATSRLRGSIASLRFELPSLDPGGLRSRLGAVEEQAARLEAGLDSALAWARARDGSMEPAVEALPVLPALRSALAEVRQAMADKGMACGLDCPDPGPSVLADRRILGIVLGNALSNAVEHGAGPLAVSVRREGSVVSVDLRNAVPGRPSLEASDASGASIRGLGLPLCAELCTRMGGSFSFVAKDGMALARVELPCVEGRLSSTS
ncbi:MAG TPA: tetratricopeptide repeat-containing sensor histidine kinase [Spirochaetales bacterium]|nr:tetratricopeptide repeat-containing sensor histidine kinase [Spirochaetales bacterium]